jgi:hypothetical protein
MSPRSARDVRDQLRSAAAGEGRKVAQAEEPGPREPATPKARRVRITVDLDREDHRALRRWVADEETDAQRVIRALLGELFRDDKLAARVRAQVEGTRFR